MWALVRADVPSLSINLSRVDQNRNLVRRVLSGKSQIEHHSGSRMPIGVVHRYGLGIGQPAKEEEKADPFHVSLRNRSLRSSRIGSRSRTCQRCIAAGAL